VDTFLSTQGITGWPSGTARISQPSFMTWFFNLIAGALEPFFPVLASGFVGTVIGYAVTMDKPPKKLLKIGYSCGTALVALGAGLLLFARLPFNIYGRPLIQVYFIQLGAQILLLMIMFTFIEYRGKGMSFANIRLIRFFRRWGMIALTIYGLELFDAFPKGILTLLSSKTLGINFLDKAFGKGELHWALLAALYSIIWYELLVLLWSKVNFKFSYEWFTLRFQSIATKNVSDRLNVDQMMNQVEWMSFKDEEEPTQDEESSS
jgi:hypothetical protein